MPAYRCKGGAFGQTTQAGQSLHSHITPKVAGLRRFAEDVVVTGKELKGSQAFTWGGVFVGRKLWDEPNLGQIIADCVGKGSKGREVAEAAFVLIASRLCKPSSEHGMARWLEEAYVCDRRGRRWIPLWRPFEKVTAEDPLRVEPKQLQFWYRTLDSLITSKKAIEERLYFEIRDLFSMEIDLVFYDITSLYFEGEGPPSLARGGYSRDGKPRNKQIIFGVVMANGFPIATHIFPGNTACKSTVRKVVKDLERRFGIRQIIFVGDRGMVSEENLSFIENSGHRYLVGLKRRRDREAWSVLENLGERWQRFDCETEVQEVLFPDGKERYFVVKSKERSEYERKMRLANSKACREGLERIRKAVQKGNLTDPSKIGKKVGEVLSKTAGYRYFSWEVTKGGEFRRLEDFQRRGL